MTRPLRSQSGHWGQLAFGHVHDVEVTADDFVETFHDEGMTDKVACMEAWHEVGSDVVLRPDHVPTLEGEPNDDPAYPWLGRLHAVEPGCRRRCGGAVLVRPDRPGSCGRHRRRADPRCPG